VRPYLEKPHHKKIELVDWLKVKALDLSHSITKKEKEKFLELQ
jgi:hypothetical protein